MVRFLQLVFFLSEIQKFPREKSFLLSQHPSINQNKTVWAQLGIAQISVWQKLSSELTCEQLLLQGTADTGPVVSFV